MWDKQRHYNKKESYSEAELVQRHQLSSTKRKRAVYTRENNLPGQLVGIMERLLSVKREMRRRYSHPTPYYRETAVLQRRLPGAIGDRQVHAQLLSGELCGGSLVGVERMLKDLWGRT